MIERKNGKVFVQFQGQMITKVGEKFVTDKGAKVDGRKVRGALRNEQQLGRQVVVQLRSAFNRHFGGDAQGEQYTYN